MTKRKQKGGEMLNCEKEGFTKYMKEADFGITYNKPVGEIHRDAELWTFEKLKEFTFDGRMVDWWRRVLKIHYTNEELTALRENETLATLGAFYHRYKVVSERYGQAIRNAKGGLKEIFQNKNFPSGPTSYTSDRAKKMHISISKYFSELEEYAKSNEIHDLAIEIALDRVQCLMFYIVKHKGELPPGFRMDPRIEKKAREPISLTINDENPKDNLDTNNALRKIHSTLKTFDIIIKENKELTPYVSFGIFSESDP